MRPRTDLMLWLGGMVFLLLLTAAYYGAGHARGWDARSGYTHNQSASSTARFLPEPFVPEPGVYKRSYSSAADRWYYWKLPPSQATAWTRLFPWLCYVSHNAAVWCLIYLAQQHKAYSVSKQPRYSTTPDKYNYWLLGVNAFFHVMHLINTEITYDALAQDVSIASSQSSVIALLVLILTLEFKDRGIFFGLPSRPTVVRWLSGPNSIWALPTEMVRKYHGYGFAWAAIYTFWYHPMENTIGHAFGFSHTWMLLLQGSLVFTRFHLNKYWCLLLEVWVCIHGGVVAMQTQSPEPGKELWPMFALGFLFVYAMTSVFGLPFWQRIPVGVRVLPPLLYVASVLGVYGAVFKQWERIAEVIRIPGIYYMLFLIGWLQLVAMLKLEKACSARTSEGQTGQAPLLSRRALWLSLTALVYAAFVAASFLVEFYDLQVPLIVLTLSFSTAFTVGILVAMMFYEQLIPLRSFSAESSPADLGKVSPSTALADREGEAAASSATKYG